MSISNLFDKYLVFNSAKIELAESLFPTEKIEGFDAYPIRRASARNLYTLECYYIDKLFAHRVSHEIIEKCFSEIESAIKKEKNIHLLSYEIKRQYPVETLFFWRVFKRAQNEQGVKLLLELQSNISKMEEPHKSIWETSIITTQSPPIFNEYIPEYKKWEVESIKRAYKSLKKEFENDKLKSSSQLQKLENFTFSYEYEKEIYKSKVEILTTVLSQFTFFFSVVYFFSIFILNTSRVHLIC